MTACDSLRYLTFNQVVVGSIPTRLTTQKNKDLAGNARSLFLFQNLPLDTGGTFTAINHKT